MPALALVLALFAFAPPPPATLEDLSKEPSLERRSDLALGLAERRLAEARTFSTEGDAAKTFAALEDVAAASEFSLKSLRDTGKKASKLSRFFKRGELKTRDFLRRLESLISALPFDDRPAGRKFHDRVQAVHEDFLHGIMSGK
jgi:hypothetical protein